jgi:hypothetical protein
MRLVHTAFTRHARIRSGTAVASLRTSAVALLTPREVERRYPDLSRRTLAQRRAMGLPPHPKLVLGCFMYDAAETEAFAADCARDQEVTFG